MQQSSPYCMNVDSRLDTKPSASQELLRKEIVLARSVTVQLWPSWSPSLGLGYLIYKVRVLDGLILELMTFWQHHE